MQTAKKAGVIGKESQKKAGKTPEKIEIIKSDIKPSALDKLQIVGGNRLDGTIPISGAKNAALKHMCASILSDEAIQLQNMPVTLHDVRTLAELLNHLGVNVALRSDGVAILHARKIKSHTAPYDLVRKMRASVLVLGPLLARHGEAEVSLPGGCAIGARPLDLHINALREMGAEIDVENGYIKAKAPKGGLRGAEITFPQISVGATENLMMAATLAKGVTTLYNTACEPEIVDQGNALIKMGAKIEGLGTNKITIEGTDRLHGTTHSVIPDRIETGTWICAIGLAGGKLRLQNTNMEFIGSMINSLKNTGIDIKQEENDIIVSKSSKESIRGTDIMTDPYPGFPTDLQAQFMAMLTTCDGAGMVTETVFENRFMHVPELCRMGADITVHGRSAIIRGVDRLKGAEVMATDLRASVAMVIAALVAEGKTTINRIYHLERGYENIVEKLSSCGIEIKKIT